MEVVSIEGFKLGHVCDVEQHGIVYIPDGLHERDRRFVSSELLSCCNGQVQTQRPYDYLMQLSSSKLNSRLR
jgi:hypothetical protein